MAFDANGRCCVTYFLRQSIYINVGEMLYEAMYHGSKKYIREISMQVKKRYGNVNRNEMWGIVIL